MLAANSNAPSISETDNWLTAQEISTLLGGKCLSFVRRILKGLVPKPDGMLDPCGRYNAEIHPFWNVEKRADKGHERCLHISQLSNFSRFYELDRQKTDEWLSLDEVVQYFSKQAQCRISNSQIYHIFREIERSNPQDTQDQPNWQIAQRRYKKAFHTCMHISELERLGKQYHLCAPPQEEGWLTGKELAENLEAFKDRNRQKFEDVLDRLSPTEDPFVMCDRINGKNWQAQIFNVKGAPTPCLHFAQFEAFATCYRTYKSDYAPETPEWLSAQDLADYMGAVDCELIEALFAKFTPVYTAGTVIRQKPMHMLDSTGKCVWRMEVFDNIRRLHEGEIESFIAKYQLARKLTIKEDGVARAEQLNFNLRFAS